MQVILLWHDVNFNIMPYSFFNFAVPQVALSLPIHTHTHTHTHTYIYMNVRMYVYVYNIIRIHTIECYYVIEFSSFL